MCGGDEQTCKDCCRECFKQNDDAIAVGHGVYRVPTRLFDPSPPCRVQLQLWSRLDKPLSFPRTRIGFFWSTFCVLWWKEARTSSEACFTAINLCQVAGILPPAYVAGGSKLLRLSSSVMALSLSSHRCSQSPLYDRGGERHDEVDKHQNDISMHIGLCFR